MLRCLFAALAVICGSALHAADRPNIIYILADDLGWTDIACQGSKYYETPNIDRLAAQGIRLTQYHNCQNCQPTRAAVMTAIPPTLPAISFASKARAGSIPAGTRLTARMPFSCTFSIGS